MYLLWVHPLCPKFNLLSTYVHCTSSKINFQIILQWLIIRESIKGSSIFRKHFVNKSYLIPAQCFPILISGLHTIRNFGGLTSSSSLLSFTVHIFPFKMGWTSDDCPPHHSILCHVFLCSQHMHIPRHTPAPLFLRPSYLASALNSQLLHLIQHNPLSFVP